MMIWKFPLLLQGVQTVTMPAGSVLLSVQLQTGPQSKGAFHEEGTLCLWALVDGDQSEVEKVIFIIGTGEPIPSSFQLLKANFLGTVQQGRFVWHVFY